MNIHETYVGPGEMFGDAVKHAIALSKEMNNHTLIVW